MKNYIFGLTSILLTVIIYEAIKALTRFNYNLFRNEFKLSSLLIDIGIFMAIFLPVYLVIKKAIYRKT